MSLIASTTGLLNSCRHTNSLLKRARDVVSDWLAIFRLARKSLYQGHLPAMNLQCTVQFLRYRLPTLLQELNGPLQVHYVLSVYFLDHTCRLHHVIRQWRGQSNFYLKMPETY